MKKVSIIMPVYNSEVFIPDAIESVLNQTYSNFELIAVDDGSTDNSLDILKKYSEKDSRVKIFHKENGGISSARNYGLKNATGIYIAFLDNDDEYLPDLLEENVKLLESSQADMVKFQKIKLYIEPSSDGILPPNSNNEIHTFENEEIWKHFEYVNKFGGTIWNIIYRKDFLDRNHILFPETSRNEIEDHRFNLECYKHLHKIVCNFKYYYLWKVRINHSTTGRFIKDRFENIKKEGNDLYLFLQSKEIDILNPSFWSKIKVNYLINILVVMNYDNSGFGNRKKFKKYLKSLKEYELFQRKCTIRDFIYLFKNDTKMRTIATLLFDFNFFSFLYLLSILKLRRDIKKKNRRF